MWNLGSGSPRMHRVLQSQRKWLRYSGTDVFLEIKMELWNFGDWSKNLDLVSLVLHIGQFSYGWIIWEQEEDTRRESSFVLIILCHKFCTFERSKVIPKKIPWIRLYWTMCWSPNDFFEYIYHVGSGFNLHSIIKSRLIAGGWSHGRDRQTVFFTAVDPMDKKLGWARKIRLNTTEARCVQTDLDNYSRHAVHWVKIGRAQHMELKFFQTKSNAIFPHDTLPPSCMEKVMSRKSKEILYTKTESPRPAPTVMHKSTWRKDLDSKKKLLKEKSNP